MPAQAYILIEAAAGKVNDIVGALNSMPRTVQAERVTGPYDVITIIHLESLDELGAAVNEIHEIDGIARTISCSVANLTSG